jgi:hypothetical protein
VNSGNVTTFADEDTYMKLIQEQEALQSAPTSTSKPDDDEVTNVVNVPINHAPMEISNEEEGEEIETKEDDSNAQKSSIDGRVITSKIGSKSYLQYKQFWEIQVLCICLFTAVFTLSHRSASLNPILSHGCTS